MMNSLTPNDWQKGESRSESDRDDIDLLHRLKMGDEGAWGIFVQQYSGRLFNYLAANLPDYEAVEDVLSETFFAALKELKNFAGPTSLLTFIYALANRKLSDYWRSKQRQESAITTPSQVDVFAQESITMHEALARLTDRERQILLLRYSAGLSLPEIAQALNSPLKAAESQMARARQHLRAVLNDLDSPALSLQLENKQVPNFKPAIQMIEEQIARCLAQGMEHEAKLLAHHAALLKQSVIEAQQEIRTNVSADRSTQTDLPQVA